ncbi:MAG: hypothetical protein AAGD38_13755 [Acidobacteriota bacterium]
MIIDALQAADATRFHDHLVDRFGIPHAVLDDFSVHQPGRQRLFMMRRGIDAPMGFEIQAIGIPFAYTAGVEPRLTHGALRLLGHHATRNVIDLDHADDASRFFTRDELDLPETLRSRCTAPGQVLVRYDGVVLGLARLDAEGRLRSQLRKEAYSLRAGIEP